jgi:hypothetical protein
MHSENFTSEAAWSEPACAEAIEWLDDPQAANRSVQPTERATAEMR